MEKSFQSDFSTSTVTNEVMNKKRNRFINQRAWLKDGENIKGAVTVAISKKGITSFCTNGLIDMINKQIEEVKVPDEGVFLEGFTSGLGVYDLGVNVNTGKLSINNLATSAVNQIPGGMFSISIKGDLKLAYKNWHESYYYYVYNSGNTIKHYCDRDLNDFSLTIRDFKLEMTIQFSVADNNLKIEVIKCNSFIDPAKIDLIFPPQSFLQSRMKCVKDAVKQKVVEIVTKIDFGAMIKKIMDHLFEQIPNSGHLTDDIMYHFPVVGLQFNNNNSMEAGITGQVTYKGQSYPGELPMLPYPAVVEEKDMNFDIHEYEFNALLWSFYEAGDLHLRLTGDMTNDPKEFNTEYYHDIPGLEWMAEKYPNSPIVVYITALDSPTVSLVPESLSTVINVECDLKAIHDGEETSLIKLIVNQTDDLKNLKIVTGKDIQKVTFKFVLNKFDATIESSIEPVDPTFFKIMWKMIVEPYYANLMGKVGETGIPLPSMNIFSLGEPEIKLNNRYLSLSTNICKPL